MVGKPNLPKNLHEGIKGSSAPDPAFDPLDQERASSMGDEGGVTGASVHSSQVIREHGHPFNIERALVYFGVGLAIGGFVSLVVNSKSKKKSAKKARRQ